ncbi:acyltransferase [Virgibacillus halodenitrificans]|uniref:acyltransferase n=1 Tax=Virgibacillus halodenitrificans TaxID=1482 RepID=UPI001FB35F0A|nr:acyltransferase [Virgibacillus halodenitrificans]MCJ0929615.1 acyltransferase [Virgibacillus halodenitrificans]WHX26070.1 acyltransferase [Virgibacillus halodenitrificans]
MNREKKYYYELSFIRAIACLCVIMVHVTAGYYYESGKNFDWITQFFNQISRYGTPAFAIISGFLLYNQAINRNFNLKFFWKSRLTKVVIPFFIWSILYLILKWSYGQFTLPSINSIEERNDFIYFFLTGKSNYHLYFIAIVVQFYLVFPLLQLFKSQKNLLLFTLISFFINYFFVENTISLGEGFLNKFINERVFILNWIYYFFLGGLLVFWWPQLVKLIKNNAKYSTLLGLIVVIGGVFEYQFNGWIESNRPMNMINLPILFIALAGVYNLISNESKIKSSLIKIGNLSMGIYLVHPLILFFMRRYSFFNHFYENTLYLPLLFGFTLLTSILLIKIILKLPFGSYIVTVANTTSKNNHN